jgi:RNA polymerase sigma-70 factor (ECF subfamily)
VTASTLVDAPTRAAPHVDLSPDLARARSGDGAAQERLYRRFARVVHGIALSAVGPADAEDVAQEAFAAAFRGLDAVRDAAALPGWLCAIARNAALDHARRRARRPASPLEREPAAKPTTRDEGELRLRVLARVRELPDAYRETLVLRLVEGLTGPEIAERTGLGAASVRVNLCRGMALLRPLLREEGWP